MLLIYLPGNIVVFSWFPVHYVNVQGDVGGTEGEGVAVAAAGVPDGIGRNGQGLGLGASRTHDDIGCPAMSKKTLV